MNSTHLENIPQLSHLPTIILYYKTHIQITSNHSNENVETKIDNSVNKMTTLNLIHLKYYTAIHHYSTIYYTYQLLHWKRHIQATSNHSNVNVEIEKNNRENKSQH